MTAPCVTACSPWTTLEDVRGCTQCEDTYGGVLDDAVIEDNIPIASDLLYELSGKQFPGTCREVIRPCCQSECGCSNGPSSLSGVHWAGCSCTLRGACTCRHIPEIRLGFRPITTIQGVILADSSNPDYPGSTVLDPDLYRVDDFEWLVRLPNPDASRPGWPCCQDMVATVGELDTFQVDFTYGLEPPPTGQAAARVLACELSLLCVPEGAANCRLPRNITQLSRQGITVLLAAVEGLRKRPNEPPRFNIPEIDMFLRAYNPFGLDAPNIVLSPDLPDHGRRAGTWTST